MSEGTMATGAAAVPAQTAGPAPTAGTAAPARPAEPGQPPYKVVINHEEQYSVWPADRENALGWFDEGTVGDRDHCLRHIGEVWTDMRPRSLREYMTTLQPS